ncbi:MAG: phosphoribosylaminoimidazolesuccinocarboxamide synthase [Acidobacteriota bacterium]
MNRVLKNRVVLQTNFEGVPIYRRGKVRDIYAVGENLLMVATDRISAFDVVLPTGIPDKGKVLTQLSLHWFSATSDMVPNHVLTADVARYPESLRPWRDELELRSMLVRRTRPIPVECVVRGYLYGSGWEEYRRTGSVCGIPLPTGLAKGDKLPEPLFTPATKAESGHDVNVSESQVDERLGPALARRLKEVSLELYRFGSSEAAAKGIIIADTKFEFGLHGDRLLLIDELLTPDSSRFWPREAYRPGRDQPSYDKQYVRDYLLKLDWDKTPPGPELPADVVAGTRDRYLQALQTLTDKNQL